MVGFECLCLGKGAKVSVSHVPLEAGIHGRRVQAVGKPHSECGKVFRIEDHHRNTINFEKGLHDDSRDCGAITWAVKPLM